MDVAFQEQILRCITLSTEWLNRDSSGGAHTEVLRIDGEALARRLAPLADGPAARRRLEEQAARVAARFLLKRGKIRDFQMRLVGSRENVIPRTAVSYAFGPVGYTIHPSLEKVRIDVADAVRQIPYFGAGQREIQLAPDILESLARAARGQESSLHPGRTDPFLVRLGEDGRSQESVYEIAARDPYFQGRAAGWRELRDVQQTVRRHPLSTGMEERLRRFFDAPITVGWRDVLRYAKGSRHPDFGWQTARELVARCFDRWSGECFLLPEITYYAPALDGTPESLARMRASNREAAASLARVLEARLPRAARQLLGPGDAEQIAWDLLEFHHDYPVYRVEPYQGVISVSMARMVARSGVSLASVLAGVGLPEPRNRDVRLFLERPLAARRIVSELRPRDLRKTVAALEAALAHERQRSGGAPGGGFRRIDRTFYTFQERADHTAATLGRVERVLTLEDL
ncbi:MAG: hypothetical protein FJ098_09540, partial [Deltaproteobacteria bacterium]|nr:hypothetical protein [Deltaproteobacteria bacterium]